jgi:hypothetical protein
MLLFIGNPGNMTKTPGLNVRLVTFQDKADSRAHIGVRDGDRIGGKAGGYLAGRRLAEALGGAVHRSVHDEHGGAKEGKDAERSAPESGKKQEAGARKRFELSGFHVRARSKLRSRTAGITGS